MSRESHSMATKPKPTSAEGSSASTIDRTLERETRLRAQPHARVLTPESVECLLCKKEIRLSTKSAYDAFHWNKHIDRCAKLTPTERAARVERAARTADRKKRTSMAKEAQKSQLKGPRTNTLTIRLRAKRSSAASSPAPPSFKGDSGEGSPPTSNDHQDANGSATSPPGSHSSPTPQTPSPPPEEQPPSPEPMTEEDLLMEGYYIRTRRRCRREQTPFTFESLSRWSWKDVKEPVWIVPAYSTAQVPSYPNSAASIDREISQSRDSIMNAPQLPSRQINASTHSNTSVRSSGPWTKEGAEVIDVDLWEPEEHIGQAASRGSVSTDVSRARSVSSFDQYPDRRATVTQSGGPRDLTRPSRESSVGTNQGQEHLSPCLQRLKEKFEIEQRTLDRETQYRQQLERNFR